MRCFACCYLHIRNPDVQAYEVMCVLQPVHTLEEAMAIVSRMMKAPQKTGSQSL